MARAYYRNGTRLAYPFGTGMFVVVGHRRTKLGWIHEVRPVTSKVKRYDIAPDQLREVREIRRRTPDTVR